MPDFAVGTKRSQKYNAKAEPVAEDEAQPGATASSPAWPVNLVQLLTSSSERTQADAGRLRGSAARATSGSSAPLPHLEAIQKAFGRYDISTVLAHTDHVAAEETSAMGADAFTSGSHVAFAREPDLRTAAHEAAHVVQQRGGVWMSGGIGRRDDRYERHADAVADLVVAGRSSETLLATMAGHRMTPAVLPHSAPIQLLQKQDEVTLQRHIQKQAGELGLNLSKKVVDAQVKILSARYPGHDAKSLQDAMTAANAWLAAQTPVPKKEKPVRQRQLEPVAPVETPPPAPLTLAQKLSAQPRVAKAPTVSSPVAAKDPLETEFPDYTPKARKVCKMYKTPKDYNSQTGYAEFDLSIKDLQDVVSYLKDMGASPFIAKASRKEDQHIWQLKTITGGSVKGSRSPKSMTFHVNISPQLEGELQHFARLNGLEIKWPGGTRPVQMTGVIGAGRERK